MVKGSDEMLMFPACAESALIVRLRATIESIGVGRVIATLVKRHTATNPYKNRYTIFPTILNPIIMIFVSRMVANLSSSSAEQPPPPRAFRLELLRIHTEGSGDCSCYLWPGYT
jgi:hypothetical protein